MWHSVKIKPDESKTIYFIDKFYLGIDAVCEFYFYFYFFPPQIQYFLSRKWKLKFLSQVIIKFQVENFNHIR